MSKSAVLPPGYAAGAGIPSEGIRDKQHVDFTLWPPDMLAAYIEKEHHRYIKEQAPRLVDQLLQIANERSTRAKHVLKIRLLFAQCTLNLSAHMQIEESVVFPLVRKLVHHKESKLSLREVQQLYNHIIQGNYDHNHFIELFSKIRCYSNNYTVPEHTPDTCAKTFAMLKVFEEDLLFHINLEQNVLFPGLQRLCDG